MKRKQLRKMNGERTTFCATFARYGTKPGYMGRSQRTMLLRKVRRADTSEIVCDHVWFTVGKRLAALGDLEKGNIVEFDARVSSYKKGYRGRRIEAMIENPQRFDYKLSNPTRMHKIEPEIEQ